MDPEDREGGGGRNELVGRVLGAVAACTAENEKIVGLRGPKETFQRHVTTHVSFP